jgi:hypothetical protein
VHHYSYTKVDTEGEVEFLITIREYAKPKMRDMKFFAQADKEVNQGEAAHRPSGWSDTLLGALASCVREIRRFPYQGPR